MKREPEELDALVEGVLQRRGPIGAYALAASLREQGYAMTEAQAYRVLKRLIARGQARQIWLGRRYLMRRPSDPPALALSCSSCGSLRLVPVPSLDAELRATATAHGFAVEDAILEASGRCDTCQQKGAAA